jgi:hypothetical protein
MDGVLVARAAKRAYYGVPAAGGTGDPVFHRMQGFTDLSTSKNSKEYNRQYVDESFEQTDVTGYSPSESYGFDQYKGNAVHDDIVKITDDELIGNDAIRQIVIVDLSHPGAGANTYAAIKRPFAVIPDSEGGSLDAYTYSGNFKVKGSKEEGFAVVDDTTSTCTFTAGAEPNA